MKRSQRQPRILQDLHTVGTWDIKMYFDILQIDTPLLIGKKLMGSFQIVLNFQLDGNWIFLGC